MDIYEVKMETRRADPKYKIIGALCLAVLFFIALFGLSVLFPTSGQKNTRQLSVAVEIGTIVLLASLLRGFFRPVVAPLGTYKLLVDEHSITGVTNFDGWMRWFVIRKTVREGRVRNIREIKPTPLRPAGLLLSERGSLGTRMLGCVFLPQGLPEYDHLREIVEGWRSDKR